ncbi:MAG: MBL fold metallo-hydrolase, partial [bacterium]
APSARLAANSLAVMRMSTTWPVPMHRVYWLNSGDSISLSDRRLTAVRPPLFDNPTTIGIYDNKSETFFSADCFGAILPSRARTVEDIPEENLTQGVVSWAGVDSPWVHTVEPSAYSASLKRISEMAPKMILSAHLPLARGKTSELLEMLARVPAMPPFVAPDQSALEQILAQEKRKS